MDTSNRRVWQFAAGDTNRSYAQVLIDWDVVAIGPGRYGCWPDCRQHMHDGGWSGRKIGEIRSFYEMNEGEIVVLRLGTTDAYGVGEVVADPLYLDAFGDVDGWDLQHVRRVRWLWTYDESPKSFPTHTLQWGRTLGRLKEPSVLEWLQTLSIPAEAWERELKTLPSEPHEVEIDEIGSFLFDQGTAANAIDSLLDRIGELIRIAQWYARVGHEPSEYETLTYLIVPLLRSLGWTPQRMGIEWNRVDVALFDRLPRSPENMVAAVEAKKKDIHVLRRGPKLRIMPRFTAVRAVSVSSYLTVSATGCTCRSRALVIRSGRRPI